MIAELIARLRGDSSSFDTMMNRSTRSITDFKGNISSIAPAIAGSFSMAAVVGFTKEMASAGAEIEKMARTTGLSTDAIQRLHFAAKETDTQIESLDKSLVRMQRNAVEALRNPGGAQAQGFRDLGVTIEDLKSLAPEELFLKLADGVQNSKDQALALNAVMATLGRTGVDTYAMLSHGSKELNKTMAEAPVIAKETIQALEEAHRTFQRFGPEAMQIGAAVAVFFTHISDAVMGLVAHAYAGIAGLGTALKTGSIKEAAEEIERILYDVDKNAIFNLDMRVSDRGIQEAKDEIKRLQDEANNPKLPPPDRSGEVETAKTADESRMRATREIESVEQRIAQEKQRAAEEAMTAEERRKELQGIIASEQARMEDASRKAINESGTTAAANLAMAKESLKTEEARVALARLDKEEAVRMKREEDRQAAEDAREAEKAKKERLKELERNQEAVGRMIVNDWQRRGSVQGGMMLLPKTDPILLTLQRETNQHLMDIKTILAGSHATRRGGMQHGSGAHWQP